MYDFVGFNIALPVAIHCFHPDCAACVKFLYASLVCYDVLYDCVNYISLYWASAIKASTDGSLSLSHTHKTLTFAPPTRISLTNIYRLASL